MDPCRRRLYHTERIETRIEHNKTQELLVKHVMEDISSLQKTINSFNEKILTQEMEGIQSQARMEMLSKEVRTLFSRTLENSQRVSQLETQLKLKVHELNQ